MKENKLFYSCNRCHKVFERENNEIYCKRCSKIIMDEKEINQDD